MTDEEIIAVVTAHKEGKTIEFSLLGEEYWTLTTFPHWDFSRYNYRVKPEPHYRPFKTTEEVMEAIEEHGDWLKYKGAYCHICVVYNHCCDFNGFSLEYKDAIKNDVKFKDGTPFGKLEE